MRSAAWTESSPKASLRCVVARHEGEGGRAETFLEQQRRCRRGVRGSAGVEGGGKRAMRGGKDGLVRTAGRHGELDAAHADGDKRADLDELAADGGAGGIGQVGRLQGDAAQAFDENIS